MIEYLIIALLLCLLIVTYVLAGMTLFAINCEGGKLLTELRNGSLDFTIFTAVIHVLWPFQLPLVLWANSIGGE
jgi:hypothetical protein